MTIRALIVDNEPLARLGIATRLQAYADMLVVAECATGEEALPIISQTEPDLLFVDVCNTDSCKHTNAVCSQRLRIGVCIG